MAINLSLSKMPWYGQVVACAAISAGAVFAFWNFYDQGASQAINAQRTQLSSLKSEIERGHREERRLPEFRRELASLERQMAIRRLELPEERDVADLLRRVQGMATQSSLTILGFTPQSINKKAMYVEWPIGLKLEGNYHDLGLFLERVSKFPRIINVSNLKVKAIDKNCKCASTSTITAELTATTFVLVEQPKSGTAAAPGVPVTPGTPAATPSAPAPAPANRTE